MLIGDALDSSENAHLHAMLAVVTLAVQSAPSFQYASQVDGNDCVYICKVCQGTPD